MQETEQPLAFFSGRRFLRPLREGSAAPGLASGCLPAVFPESGLSVSRTVSCSASAAEEAEEDDFGALSGEEGAEGAAGLPLFFATGSMSMTPSFFFRPKLMLNSPGLPPEGRGFSDAGKSPPGRFPDREGSLALGSFLICSAVALTPRLVSASHEMRNDSSMAASRAKNQTRAEPAGLNT